ncbi:hypothetical protein S83_066826, partial [Arachis hypogaea]
LPVKKGVEEHDMGHLTECTKARNEVHITLKQESVPPSLCAIVCCELFSPCTLCPFFLSLALPCRHQSIVVLCVADLTSRIHGLPCSHTRSRPPRSLQLPSSSAQFPPTAFRDTKLL